MENSLKSEVGQIIFSELSYLIFEISKCEKGAIKMKSKNND